MIQQRIQVTNKEEWKGTFFVDDSTMFPQATYKKEWECQKTKFMKKWTCTMLSLHFKMNNDNQAMLWLKETLNWMAQINPNQWLQIKVNGCNWD
jgi:hypothetical protein